MSSTILYLAIVAVWAVVLVPMYLRRDTDTGGISRLLPRRSGMTLPDEDGVTVEDTTIGEGPAHHGVDAAHPYDSAEHGASATGYDEVLDDEAEGSTRRRPSRATVIARRRRRTFLLVVTLVAATVTVATGLAPWWVAMPPVGLFLGHLSLLRVAVGMDAARHQRMIEARAHARARAAEEVRLAEEAVKAEIIDLAERARARDVFDQYAEDVARAVGD